MTCVSGEVIYPRYYGGTCINDAGKPVILTTDTTKRELIRKLAGCDEVVVLPCAISYRYLKNVDDKIKSCLGDRPGLIEKVGINTFGTVSYTHLDVYKRQIWANLVTPVMKTNSSHWSALFSKE